MIVLGLNKGETLRKKELHQGSVAIAEDGTICFHLAEERSSRVKYAGGFKTAIERLPVRFSLDRTGHGHIDKIAISTCCERVDGALKGTQFDGDDRTIAIDHHISHAVLAFRTSGFRKALVVVADAGGNTLEGPLSPEKWWEYSRQQNSYYVASTAGMDLLERDFEGRREAGLGEIYRAFTIFLGFRSQLESAKVMALAAYGDASRIARAPWVRLEGGRLATPIRNRPLEPLKMVAELERAVGADFGDPRTSDRTEVSQQHRDVAAYAQRGLELALVRKIQYLARRTGIHNVCLSGGVALNCVANSLLARSEGINRIYVPWAPGDDGQALGNVLMWSTLTPRRRRTRSSPGATSSAAYLGSEQAIHSGDLAQCLENHGIGDAVVLETDAPFRYVAQSISAGHLVCVFEGASESGPRALGNRSILGDATREETRERLNVLKQREWFQPIAPSILAESVAHYFEHPLRSPFMSFALRVRKSHAHEIPAVVHNDGTARLQSVDGNRPKTFLRKVLEEYHNLTGVPILANTSFNLPRAPIVETVTDAVDAFTHFSLGTMAIGRFVVFHPVPAEMEKTLFGEGTVKSRLIEARGESELPTNASSLISELRRVTRRVVFVRTAFPLNQDETDPYVDWLQTGKKFTTIRFRRGGIEVPQLPTMPLYATTKFGVPVSGSEPLGRVRVERVRYMKFGDLTDTDARRDGFESYTQMRARFQEGIYKGITEGDWVTAYEIHLERTDGHREGVSGLA